MTLSAIDTVCIDADGDEVHQCKWNGWEIRIERAHHHGADALLKALLWLDLRPGYRLLYRVVSSAATESELAATMERMAEESGAGSVRRLPMDIRADPGITAARQAADRHRLDGVVCLEWRKVSFQCAVVDGRGVVLAHDRAGKADRNAICEKLGRIQKEAIGRVGGDIQTLVCYGSASSLTAAAEIG